MTTPANLPLGPRVLELDYDREIERVCARLKEVLSRDLSRRGLVVAMSGGIDSSVSAALSVRALGAERVYGLLLPERDSSGGSVISSCDNASKADQTMEIRFPGNGR